MEHNINPRRIDWAVGQVMREVGNGSLNAGEVLVVLSETLARVIVHLSDNPVQMVEAAKVAQAHMARTIEIGAKAKGFAGAPTHELEETQH